MWTVSRFQLIVDSLLRCLHDKHSRSRTIQVNITRIWLVIRVSCYAFKLGISSEQDVQCSEQDAQCSEQDAKPAAWLRLTHYGKDFAMIKIKV